MLEKKKFQPNLQAKVLTVTRSTHAKLRAILLKIYVFYFHHPLKEEEKSSLEPQHQMTAWKKSPSLTRPVAFFLQWQGKVWHLLKDRSCCRYNLPTHSRKQAKTDVHTSGPLRFSCIIMEMKDFLKLKQDLFKVLSVDSQKILLIQSKS